MKKTFNTIAVSTIVIGALIPTIQTIADTTNENSSLPTSTTTSTGKPSSTLNNVESASSSSKEDTIKTTTLDDSQKISSSQETENTTTKTSTTVISPLAIGDQGAINVQRGLQNAKTDTLSELEQTILGTNWSIIRTTNIGVTPFNTFGTVFGTTGNGYNPDTGHINPMMQFYGAIYLGMKRGDGSYYESSLLFSLGADDVPTAEQIKEMSSTTGQDYSMDSVPLENFSVDGYSIDDSSIGRVYTFGLVAPNSSVISDNVKKSTVTGIVVGASDSALTGFIGDTYSFTEESGLGLGLPFSVNANIRSIKVALANATFTHHISDLAVLSNETNSFTLNKIEDSRYSTPSTLLRSITTNEGVAVTPNDSNVSWKIAPDLTQITSNGSAVLEYSSDNGLKTYVRVPYTVKDDTAVNVHDSTIYSGDVWKAQDNFDSAVTVDGVSLDYHTFITQGGSIDDSQLNTSNPGTYPVSYSLDGVTSIANITVLENKQSITGSDVTKYVGDTLPMDSEFNSTATDKAGNPSVVTLNKSAVNMNQAGDYNVIISSADGQSKTVQVHVLTKQTAVNVHDSTIYVGDNWKAEDNFDSALNKDGETVDFSDITVDDSQKDTSKAGTFDVTYSFDGVTSTATITVKDKLTAVNVHDSTIYVGDNWKVEDNFDSALDKDGNTVDLSQLTVDASQVDTTKAGTYDVTYSYDGITITAHVTVKDKLIATPPKNSNTSKAKNNDGNNLMERVNNDSNQGLPKTGEESGMFLAIFGLFLLIVLGGLAWKKTIKSKISK